MKYERLGNFQSIFERKDFNYFSDQGLIKKISKIFLEELQTPEKEESFYITMLEAYLNNLESFCRWIGGDVKKIKKGYSVCEEKLIRLLKLLRQPPFQRKAISGRYLKKFNKNFLWGLSKILQGVVRSFQPGIVGKTNIKAVQIAQYILDKKEGLGKRFEFHSKTRHAFAQKVGGLHKQELVATIKLLLKPSDNQVRYINGWRDLGLGRAPVRILGEYKFFQKRKYYFLYRVTEHTAYERQLRISPDDVDFHSN